MLSDFNKAQELLKLKISEISREKDEIEKKYENRESRDEDIEQIETLNVRITAIGDGALERILSYLGHW